MTQFITDDEIQKALDRLSSADKDAQSRANRIYIAEYRKSIKALLMKKFPDLPVNAQEREAYAHPKYLEHLEAIRESVFQDEKSRFEREAAQACIDAWQTKSANERGNRP